MHAWRGHSPFNLLKHTLAHLDRTVDGKSVTCQRITFNSRFQITGFCGPQSLASCSLIVRCLSGVRRVHWQPARAMELLGLSLVASSWDMA